jgi:hypothetical protein
MKRSTVVWPQFLAVSLMLLGMGCASGSGSGGDKVYYATGKDAVTPNGLHRVKWEPFAATFLKPGAKLGGYDAVILDKVTISYQRPPRRDPMPGMDNDGMNANFALSSDATAHMKEYFGKSFAKELTRSNDFRVVDEPGPNVLRIAAHIVNLVITAPPMRDQAPDETVYTNSSGAMTLLLEAQDSLTGETLVSVGERQEISNGLSGFYSSNPVSNSGAVRQLFDNWAARLRKELDQLKALPEIPEP